ncbi:3' exoribonuclease family, domain 1 containing protein [Tritrichomonas foetus]|uniref:3' exoribonuclease family, domain 1 containing protein n=1 Tax=Tritrichomonas foetus TaxID=1144522 RepID=A0A1J4KMH9_9EUKA|nr:3' exoribonuclease family, domain 1 containing protein [Tritrichomonas foetus]|eukprot:OHT11004.1 3' exoribonuclease family, domain 1 containing protein [Tritrichomonas foetus]
MVGFSKVGKNQVLTFKWTCDIKCQTCSRFFTKKMNLGLRLGDIKGAAGSSYVELNGTKVFSAVYGPMEPDMQQQDSAVSGIIECFIEDAFQADDKFLEGLQHKFHHTFSAAIHHETYFKTLIRLSFTIVTRGPSLADAIALAGSMALVDAGIEMNDFVVSCTVGLVNGEYVPFSPSECSVRVAILPSNDEIVETEVIGKIDPSNVLKAVNSAIDGCKELRNSVQKFMNESVLNLA